MMHIRFSLLPLFCLSLLLMTTTPLQAHHLRVFAYAGGQEIIVEAEFGKNRPAINSPVRVTGEESKTLRHEGRTNVKGRYSFPLPQTPLEENLQILVDTGQGHQAHWTITQNDIPQAASTGQDKSPLPPPQTSPTTNQTPAAGECSQQIATAVELAVAREIAPLKQRLAEEIDPGPRLTEIIGGIGWIIGLAWILSFIKSNKRRKIEKEQ